MLDLRLHSNPKKSVYSRIANPTRKTAYLFALCAPHPFYSKCKNQLIGILDMLDGLDYHIKKIRTFEKAACRRMADISALRNKKESYNLPVLSRKTNYHSATHEAVAYIGRIGQLAYFFESDWFGEVIQEADVASKIPSILALMPLRNKHSAHRQQDKPWKDDCSSLGFNEYGLKHSLVGMNDNPESVKIQYSFPTKQRHPLLSKYHPSLIPDIEYLGEANNLVIFTPTKIHQRIVNEAVCLLETFFEFQP